MKCPFCSFIDSKVIDTRTNDDLSAIRRRRKCPSCKRRFTTYETMLRSRIIVIKKDGSKTEFCTQNLIHGMIKCWDKHHINMEKVEKISEKIEQELLNSGKTEVTSLEIGNLVIKYLNKIDKIACIRFASVHRGLTDLNILIEEINAFEDDK